jgi:hypothetical protein
LWFTWILLLEYSSKAKLKSSCDKAYACFKQFASHTNICVPGLCSRFYLDIFLLPLLVHGNIRRELWGNCYIILNDWTVFDSAITYTVVLCDSLIEFCSIWCVWVYLILRL